MLATQARPRPWHTAIVALLLLAACHAQGANLRFTERTALPDSGIQLMLMPKATSRPLPSPKTYYYTFTQGEKSWKEEMFDPFELWRHAQQVGAWIDRYKNTLTIVQVGSLRPRGFKRRHASREEYKAAHSAPDNQPPAQWSAAQLSKWVAEFTTAETAQLKQLRRPSNRVRGLYDVTLASPYTRNAGLLLLPAYSSAHRRKHGADWLYIQLEPGPDTDPAEARRILMAQLPRSVIPLSSGSLLRDNGAEKVEPSRMRRPPGNHSKAYQVNRDQVIQSIQNMRDWWYAETDHYIILSNLRSQKEALVGELQGTMDAMHQAYAKTIPPREETSAANVIRAFAGSDEYTHYVGNNYEWSTGIWMPRRGELVIKASDLGSGREGRKRILSIVQHEGLHQYLFYAFGKRETSIWYNEGHATFFEAATVSRRRVELPESPMRARTLAAMLKQKQKRLPGLLALSREAFYAGSDTVRAQNYALAWGLVYYLRKGAPFERPVRHTKILTHYEAALMETGSAEQATQRAFADIDMARLETAFNTFWKSPSLRRKAAGTYIRRGP